MPTVKQFEDLDIWKLAREICQEVNRLTNTSPFNKDFSLKDQMRRSSGSIMDNIAEGFEREGRKEFIQYLSVSKGSAGECRSQLYRAYDNNYITEEDLKKLFDKLILESQKIKSFIKYLNNSNYNGTKYK